MLLLEKIDGITEKGILATHHADLQAEDLIVQLFDLVNEKNELFRRQTELMYMKRDHRLEEEHADTEHQVTLELSRSIHRCDRLLRHETL